VFADESFDDDVRAYTSEFEKMSASAMGLTKTLLYQMDGLGFPEALETGAEIICSDIPPYREQLSRYGCADQVSVFPAGDAVALASAMEKILIGSRESVWRKRSGPIAFKNWTWTDAAAAYVESLSAVTPT